MTLHSPRTLRPAAVVAAIILVAVALVAVSVRAEAADPLASWVTDNADQVVEATVTASQVVTAADESIWTNYTLETKDDQFTVFDRGGVDNEAGRWQYATHGPELVVGMDVVAALAPADRLVPSELLPEIGDAWVVYGGADGVSVKPSSQDTDPSTRSAAMLPSSYFTGSRWESMPIPIRINTSVNSSIHAGTTDAITRAMAKWGAVAGADAKFQYAGTSGTTSTGTGPFTNSVFAAELSGQLGRTIWTGTNNLETITSYEVVLNSGALPYGSSWSIGASAGAYDVESVILHELGHVIGLGHTGEAYSVMYPTLYRAESKINLSRIENEGVRSLYPTSDCGFASPDAIVGTPGNDVLYGTSGNDLIIGGGGNDVILGAGGDDKLCGDQGADTIWGQGGNDTVYGGADNDKIRTGSGNDTIFGGSGDDDVNGGRNNDKILGEGGNDILKGGVDDDYVDGGDGADFVSGNGGYDVVRGGQGGDEVRGGPRPDTLYGDDDNDIVKGFGGADIMYGGSGDDQLYGGLQNDARLDGGSGSDMCNGGLGDESAAVVTGCTTQVNIP